MDILTYINKMNLLYGSEPAPIPAPRYNTQQYLQGGRVGKKPGGIVEPGVTHYGQLVQPGLGRQGYNGAEATALSFYKKDVAKFGEDALNEAAQFLEKKNYSELTDANTRAKIRYQLKKFGSVLGAEDSKKRSANIRAKRDAKIKINLIEATQEGYFEPDEFATKNGITKEQLKTEAKQLQRNISVKRGILTGKESPSTLEWLTSNDFKLDNTLKKLSLSKLIVFKRDRTGDILYDAFGRKFEKGSTTKLNPTRDLPKYDVIKKNLHEFEVLKRAITKKYPSIKFQWDHPLSKQTIKALMTGTAEELSRVNVLDAELNNGFKKALSEKYLKSLTAKDGKVNLEAKRAVEKIAKDLNINIGNISDDVKRFERGVVSLEKLNIRDEIIKSLKKQKDLSANFKSYLKNNPELFEIAGFKDTSKLGTKLTQVTDKHIQGVAKILSKQFRCGQANGISCDNPKAYIKSINEQKQLALAGDAKAAAKFNNASKAVRAARGISKFTLWGILGEVAFAPIIALPMLAKGESGSRIMGDISFGLFGENEQEELARVAGTAGAQQMKALETGERAQKLQEKTFPGARIGMDQGRFDLAQYQVREEAEQDFRAALKPFMVNGVFDQAAFTRAGGDVKSAKAQIEKDKLARKESSIFFQDKLDPTEEMVGFDAGGRALFGKGKLVDASRRAFMKWFAGITGATVAAGTGLIKWGKIAGKGKTVIKAGDTIIQGTEGMPSWFIPLVNRITKEGTDVSKKLSTIEREIVHTKKINKTDEVTVYQDMNTGNVRIEIDSPHNMGETKVQLEYKAGEVIEEGKHVGKKTKPEFEAVEIEPVGRAHGPDDYTIEWDGENVVGKVDDLMSDTTAVKSFATKKKPTIKEIVKSQKKKKEVQKVHKDESEYIVKKQGEADYDDYLPDIDDLD